MTTTAPVTETVPDPVDALARGLAVFGLPPGAKRPAPGWQRRVSTDPTTVARWWTPGDNVGVACRASNLVGIDLDRHPGDPDGVVAFTATCARYGQPWPDTFTVTTPTGGGLHLYFRVPPDRIIGSTSGGTSPLGPGIDTRGPGQHTGGHLVGPGSVIGGRRYEIARDFAIAELPAWIADLLDPRSPRTALRRATKRG